MTMTVPSLTMGTTSIRTMGVCLMDHASPIRVAAVPCEPRATATRETYRALTAASLTASHRPTRLKGINATRAQMHPRVMGHEGLTGRRLQVHRLLNHLRCAGDARSHPRCRPGLGTCGQARHGLPGSAGLRRDRPACLVRSRLPKPSDAAPQGAGRAADGVSRGWVCVLGRPSPGRPSSPTREYQRRLNKRLKNRLKKL